MQISGQLTDVQKEILLNAVINLTYDDNYWKKETA